MKGEVLDPAGMILGEDGRRYTFTPDQVRGEGSIEAGQSVDFVSMGEQARDIYVLRAPSAPTSGAVPGYLQNPETAAGLPHTGRAVPGGTQQPSYAAANTAGQYAASGASGAAGYGVVKPPARQSDGIWTYFVRAFTKNYAQFHGRARRTEYWGFILFYWLFFVLALVLDVTLIGGLAAADIEFPVPVFTLIWWLAGILPNLAITVRRLHDQDLSGWLYLICLVPYVGGFVLLVFMFIDSKPYPNKHGASPKYDLDGFSAETFA